MVVLKRTYWKVLRREIGHSLSRFLAIFAIVAIGVGFLAGLLATTPDMKVSADQYYDQTQMMDIRVVSTMGLTDEDIDSLRQTQGVAAVMPGYTADVLIDTEGAQELVARMHSLPLSRLDSTDGSYQNQVTLVSGRMPEKAGECVVLQSHMGGLALGSEIRLSAGNADLTDILAVDTLTVVGTVNAAYYISIEQENSTIGSGRVEQFVFLGEENFAYPAYTDAYLLVDGARELTAFSEEYEQLVDEIREKVEDLSGERTVIRYQEILGEANEQLADAKAEYNDAKEKADRELADAKKELDDARQEIADGEKTLAQSKKELEEGKRQLAEGEQQLAEKKASTQEELNKTAEQLDASAALLAEGQAALAEAKEQLDNAKGQIDQLKAAIAYQESQGATETVEALKGQLAQIEPVYQEGLAAYEEQAAALTQAAQEIADGRIQWEAGKKLAEEEFAAAQAQLEASREELDSGEEQIRQAEKELADGKDQLAEGEREYNEGKQEADEQLADARQQIADAEAEIAKLEEPEWFVLDRTSNVGYTSFDGNVAKINAISQVFPVFFFLVAALVALTTMTRMVEEERTQIGTLKALGYTRGAIAFQYVVYAGIATILGCVFGLAVGMWIFPTVIWGAYEILYTLPPLVIQWNVQYGLISSIAAFACTMLATLSACWSSLREVPARLMLPRAPKAGKRVFLERISFIWKHLSFTKKVTARNLIRYKKRFFMTVIGIAGCTALLLTGFGLRDSIRDIVSKQFQEIYQYNLIVGLEEGTDPQQDAALSAVLEEQVEDTLLTSQETGDISGNGETVSGTVYVPQDSGRLADFIQLRDRKTGRPVTFEADTVLLTEKFAETLGVRAGDTIQVKNTDGRTASFTLGGVVENYVQGAVYIPAGLYEEAFGGQPSYTTLVGKVEDADPEHRDQVSAALLGLDTVQGVQFTNDIQESFSDMIKNIDYIVVVLIISAGLLAFVVLYNLTNINITERQKELATIKVLGFYDREVSAYIYRETAVLTLIGTAVGLVLGIFLHAFVVRTAEVDMVMFGRSIRWLSYVLAAAMTIVFSVLVNLVMGRKMRKIDMVESMKAGE